MPTWLTLEAAKFWVAVIGSVLIAISQALGDTVPPWLTAAIAGFTAIGVYLTPNKEADDA